MGFSHRRLCRAPGAILITLLWTLLLAASPALAQFGERSSTSTSLLGDVHDDFLPVTEAFQLQGVLDGNTLILHWDVAPHYYMYRDNFRLTPDIDLALEPEFSPSVMKWDEYFEEDMAVFYHSATLTMELPEDTPSFALTVQSQGCAEAGLCYPPHRDYLQVNPATGEVSVRGPPDGSSPSFAAPASTPAPPADGEGSGLWLLSAALLALLGGIILNLMPCVFPVLSIKVMSLARADGDHLALHGWAYTFGILLSFSVFAGLLLLARAGGEAVGWGFQLQSPLLITALAYLFFVLGLSLSGLFHLGTRWMGAGDNLTRHSTLKGSFFTGVLAAVVASPCTAPFMGAALGFALTQPPVVSLAVFLSLGFGMALPMLLLCYLPGLAQRMPKPGLWMDNLKQVLAFPLYLTAVWLLWVLGRQAGSDAIIAVCTGAVLLVFGFWLMNRPAGSPAPWRKVVRYGLITSAWLIAVLVPWQYLTREAQPERWQAYSPTLLQQLRDQGQPVFVNLTADWCLTCLANERVTLNTEPVQEAFDRYNIATLKGDWTNHDPQISALLDEYNHGGVPLYLWFPAGHQGPGIKLPQLLRRDSFLEVISADFR